MVKYVKLIDSAEDFLNQSEVFRLRDPVRTNLLSTIAASVASGSRKCDRCFWWVICDESDSDSDSVVGIAGRTPPYGYVVSRMDSVSAEALAEQVVKLDPDFPFVSGNRKSGQDFLNHFLKLVPNGETIIRGPPEVELLYELKELRPHWCKDPIELFPASMDHHDLVCEWLTHFHDECKIFSPDIPSLSNALILGGRLKLLRYSFDSDQDQSRRSEWVAMAAYNEIVGDTDAAGKRYSRIGPVYTAPAYRGRGFGSAVTYLLCEEILRLQATPMLFAQAENPTSNKVYQQLGFEFVDEQVRVSLHHNQQFHTESQ